MKYLITGIGNPGEQYAHTRHNIGFDILDALAAASNISFSDKRYGQVADLKYKSRHYHLLKPNTYVNLSGKAINYYLGKLKIQKKNILVVTDDISLPFGKIRIKPKGGDAGHNGLISVIEALGTNHFARLRFGIGNDFPKGQQIEHVLGKWTHEEQTKLNERIDLSGEAIKSFGTIGIQFTMNKYNSL